MRDLEDCPLPQSVNAIVEHLKGEVRKAIVGQDTVIEQVLVALLTEGHALIEGVPGTAKTLLVKVLARAIGAQFGRIQFTPDLMPADVTGTNIFNMATSTFTLRHGPIFTDLLLADEINRTPPKTQAALLEAMEERQVTIDGEIHKLSPMFTVLATQNPIEYEGTYPLPEAQLDRFMLKILVDYPGADEELRVVANWNAGFNARRLDDLFIQPINDSALLLECRAEVRNVTVEEGVLRYIVSLIRATRNTLNISWGASPRAAVALLLCTKALAAMRGRTFVTPDDVKEMTRPVLRHRIVLRSEAEIEGATPDQVLDEVIAGIDVPR
ncbi:MAG TPA: MoxR family ATPase [Blastocatellia bacterium]|nr:MoxR family ATPase [Blastocatellia bacterium]